MIADAEALVGAREAEPLTERSVLLIQVAGTVAVYILPRSLLRPRLRLVRTASAVRPTP